MTESTGRYNLVGRMNRETEEYFLPAGSSTAKNFHNIHGYIIRPKPRPVQDQDTLLKDPNYSPIIKVGVAATTCAVLFSITAGLFAYPYWRRLVIPIELVRQGTANHMGRYGMVGAIYGTTYMSLGVLNGEDAIWHHAAAGAMGGFYSGIAGELCVCVCVCV